MGSMESLQSVSCSQTTISPSPRRPTAPTTSDAQKMLTEHSAPQPSESTSHISRLDLWLTTPTMATSQKLSTCSSPQPLPRLASRNLISNSQETEPPSRHSSNRLATVTKSANSTLCTTRPKKFATRRTTWSACELS